MRKGKFLFVKSQSGVIARLVNHQMYNNNYPSHYTRKTISSHLRPKGWGKAIILSEMGEISWSFWDFNCNITLIPQRQSSWITSPLPLLRFMEGSKPKKNKRLGKKRILFILQIIFDINNKSPLFHEFKMKITLKVR